MKSLAAHPIFEEFSRYRGATKAGYTSFDFLGSFVSHDFLRGLDIKEDPPMVDTPYPPLDEDFPAWLDLLSAVSGARESFTMIELGAGFGVWTVRGGLAAKQRGLSCRLMAVEAHPEHFEWLRRHVAAHGLDADLVEAAVSDYEGEADFCLELDSGGFWYGQSLSVPPGWRSTKVRVIPFSRLLSSYDKVDFIHIDVQGEEMSILRASVDLLRQKVKRLHIGTHSPEIEAELRELLSSRGWEPIADYAGQQVNITPWGPIRFGDGVQSWMNGAL